MREGKAVSVNFTEKRMIVLVKLCIALCGHTRVSYNHVHAVRNMDLHFPSGKGALINAQTAVEAVGNTCRVRAAHLTFTR